MPKYLVKSRLKHDQTEYKAGSVIDLREETAKPLLGSGVLSVATSRDLEDAVAANPEKKKGAKA